jgi:CTD small phosphatase-like protein 2
VRVSTYFIELIPPYIEKKTIVFDLDETLIKATHDPSKLPDGLYDVKCYMTPEDFNKKEVYLSFRPYLFEALQTLNKQFELILFTAGQEIYAESIVRVIEK